MICDAPFVGKGTRAFEESSSSRLTVDAKSDSGGVTCGTAGGLLTDVDAGLDN